MNRIRLPPIYYPFPPGAQQVESQSQSHPPQPQDEQDPGRQAQQAQFPFHLDADEDVYREQHQKHLTESGSSGRSSGSCVGELQFTRSSPSLGQWTAAVEAANKARAGVVGSQQNLPPPNDVRAVHKSASSSSSSGSPHKRTATVGTVGAAAVSSSVDFRVAGLEGVAARLSGGVSAGRFTPTEKGVSYSIADGVAGDEGGDGMLAGYIPPPIKGFNVWEEVEQQGKQPHEEGSKVGLYRSMSYGSRPRSGERHFAPISTERSLDTMATPGQYFIFLSAKPT